MSAYRHLRALVALTVSLLFASALLRAQSIDPVAGDGATATLRTIISLNESLATPARRSGMHPLLATSERLLLEERARLMLQLIEQHPEQVRSAMLSPQLASALAGATPQATTLLEREISATGELTRQIADGFDDHTHTEVLQLHVTHEAGADLHVYTAELSSTQHLQHHRVTMNGIALGGSVAAESITPALPALQSKESRGSSQKSAAAAAVSGDASSCSPAGKQKIAVLMLRFPGDTPSFSSTYAATSYWQNAVSGLGLSVSDYWNALSYGKTTASADVYNPVQLAQSYSCQDYLQLRTAALQAAAATIDLSKYTRIVLAFPAGNCTYGGLADVGCNAADTLVNHPYSVVWLPVLTRYGPNVAIWGGLAHELGHNLGLNHANTLDFGSMPLGPLDFQATNPGMVNGPVNGTGAGTAVGAVTAVDTEYGDSFSAMGIPWTGGPYSADHRAHLLGWIPSSGPDAGAATVTQPGRYTLFPAENTNGLRALRVLRDGISSSWLWVEYHQPDNGYTSANLLQITGENATSGATVHYENGYGDPDKTWQLDMAPDALPGANTFASGALLPGKTWSDPYSPLTLNVEAASPAGLTVNVGYDTPCATFTTTGDAIMTVGASGTVTVTAPPACTWSASTNATWLTLTGHISGAGNGSFGWTASANTGTAQRITYLTVGRQSTRMLQVGTGASTVSLLPQNGSAAPGDSTVFTLNVADAKGLADLRQIELDITGSGTDPCTVLVSNAASSPTFYLYNRTEDAYSTGLFAGASGTISIPGCTLSGARSGVSAHGSAAQVLLDLSFPASQPGVRSFFATAGMADALPVGIFNAGAAPQNPPPSSVNVLSSTMLNVSPATTAAGAPVTLTAQVTGTGSTLQPTGSVRFVEGSITLGIVTVDGKGVASFVIRSFAPGTHSVIAIYSGDTIFPSSTSAAAAVIVGKRAALLSVSMSSTRAFVNAPPKLTVSVTAPGSGQELPTPTGTITVKEGSADLGTATISATGVATFVLSALPAGNHVFTAVYSGDALDTPATATSPTLLVMDFALTGPNAPLMLQAGATQSNTATVLLTPGNGGFPANVAFTCNGAPARSTCSVTPGAITPDSNAVRLTVTVQTTAAALRAASAPPPHSGHRPLLALAAMPVLGIFAMRRRVRIASPMRMLFLLALLVATSCLSGCGSGGTLIGAAPAPDTGSPTPGIPTGTYSLTVTGIASDAGATLSHSVSFQMQIE